MTEMTDEERERLCAKLRREFYDGEYAASEIERLARTIATWQEECDIERERVAELEKQLAELKQTFKAAAIELGDSRSRQHPERQRKF